MVSLTFSTTFDNQPSRPAPVSHKTSGRTDQNRQQKYRRQKMPPCENAIPKNKKNEEPEPANIGGSDSSFTVGGNCDRR
jgi:hypothetical protein